MSKNKQYRNYNNYSANKSEVKVEEPVVEEVTPVTEEDKQVEEVTVELTEEIATIIEAPVVEPVPAPTIGVVNCKLLRVRSEADATADNVICELPEGTEVQLIKAGSTVDFYKVITTAGAEGFCMKKFITIK